MQDFNYSCTCCFYGAVHNSFEGCNIIYEGHWKGWALKIETFLGPEMARAKRVPFGPKKVEKCWVIGLSANILTKC